MKTLIWTGLAGAAAAVCYMFWRKRGMRVDLKGKLGRIRVQAEPSRRSRRKAAAARA